MPRKLEVIEERPGRSVGWDETAVDEERVARLVALDPALSVRAVARRARVYAVSKRNGVKIPAATRKAR